MFVLVSAVALAAAAAAAAQQIHSVSGNVATGPKSIAAIHNSGPFVSAAGSAQGISKVPQLGVADILALRRAAQQRQLISRSGVVSSQSGRLPHPYGYNFVGDSLRNPYSDLPGTGSSYGDYLVSGSAPPPKMAKPSISTRFRSFMNSLFFRTSGSVAPAFYQPAPAPTMFRPGQASFLPQPAQQPRIPQAFASKSSGSFPSSFGAVSGKQIKDFSSVSMPHPKPGSFVPSYSSSLSSPSLSSLSSSSSSSSSLSTSVLKGGSSSIGSPVSSASDPQASIATASGFYPSIAGSASSSYDKARFSSLYGSNGFTAKASPGKSSKSIKTLDQTSDGKASELLPPVQQKSPQSSSQSSN